MAQTPDIFTGAGASYGVIEGFGQSGSGAVNGHVLFSSSAANSNYNSVSNSGSVSVGLSTSTNAQSRVVTTPNGNDYNAPLFTVTSGGNVGIGTTNPQHLLQVTGTIGAEEVIVSSTGADYVFEPGYHLQSLSEVGDFVKQYRHLPEIPSAAEVRTNGVGLGEMQAKLLVKIEELTLHAIEMEEKNARLEQRLIDLEARVAPK